MVLVALALLAAPPKIAVLDARTGPGVDPAMGPYLAQILAKEVQSRSGPAPVIIAAAAPAPSWRPTRRTWAVVAGGGALALGGAGAIVGANALSQAHAGSPTALARAHLADGLFAAAVLAAGAGAYLWFA